ncbi:MAG: alpha/beta hydrolase family protein [Victivallaceae bacterium]
MHINSRFGHMMQDYYLAQVRDMSAKRRKTLAGIKNPLQAKKYVDSVRKKIAAAFGPLPERTPLNSCTTRVIKKNGFTIEKVIYYSRPGFPVTGNLYLPSGVKGKVPGVLGLCGHSQNGKADPAYQSFCQGLALKGYAVFIIDPVSQGERYQFLNTPDAEEISGRCCPEHNMLGKQLRLNGEFFGTWRAWDGIRGLDYLLSRPEVDASRVGVTGNSGGGTLTSYINALDNRPTMAAPGCFITTYLRNLENELPSDCEQSPPDMLKHRLEMSDLIIARAPRPVIILGQKNDFFDPRGTVEAYEDIKHIYSLLGAKDNIRLAFGPGNHGYSLDNRESMYRFFNEFAKVKKNDREPELAICESAELECAPGGQVINLPDNKLLRDFNLEKTRFFRETRKKIKSQNELKAAVLEKLAIEIPAATPSHRILRLAICANTQPHIFFNRFAVETEPGVTAILNQRCGKDLYHIPAADNAVLYIPHLSTYEELKDGLELDCGGESLLFGLDVRGIGETTPRTCNIYDENFFTPYNYDYFYAAHAIMLGKPYIGGKVLDVLSAAKLLKSSGIKQIHLVGKGQGAIVAAFAGLLSGDISRVTLLNAPFAYQEMVEEPVTKWPLSCMVPGILDSLDLPDVYNALAGKKLRMLAPWNALFKPLSKTKIDSMIKKYSINQAIAGGCNVDI